jgi:hypothetical protein
MTTKVKVQIIRPDAKTSEDIVYKYKGRLLGLADEMEATKIVHNWKVASRIFTCTSKKLESVTELVEKQTSYSESNITLGHLVMSIEKMSKGIDSHMLTTLSRQLLISPPISIISEIAVDRNTDLLSATIECADDSMIIIKEIKDE